MKLRSKPLVHFEWFRQLSKTKCECGCRKTQVFSWGQYIVGRWNTITTLCKECFSERVIPRLLSHAGQCGCKFKLIGYRKQLPEWLCLPVQGDLNVCSQ